MWSVWKKLSVHNLDKHRVDSPIIPFVINVNIIKTIKAMFKFFILIVDTLFVLEKAMKAKGDDANAHQ